MITVNSLDSRCPQPIIDTAKALAELEIGAVITLLANDPATWPDLQAWARMTKNLVVQVKENVYEITKLS